MIDVYEIMKMFDLNEKPYVQLGLPWAQDGYKIYFVEDGILYDVYTEGVCRIEEGIYCFQVDLYQFMGWQPMIFTSNLKMGYEDFENKFRDLF